MTVGLVNIIIVGGGIGGMTAAITLRKAGHNVTVLDSAPYFAEIGAAINVPPNSAKILERLNITKDMLKTNPLTKFVYFSWAGKDIASIETANASKGFRAHRAHLHAKLYERATEAGAITLCDSKVVKYDYETPSVTLENGKVLEADVIIASDGVNSIARSDIVGFDCPARYGGKMVHRMLIPSEKLRNDPELTDIIEQQSMWLGPNLYFMLYPVCNSELTNIVFMWKRDEQYPELRSGLPGGKASDLLKAVFTNCDPRIKKILSFADEYKLYKLYIFDPIERWVHPSGKVALLGDSAHSILPYVGQGAAQAVEDAAVIGQVFRNVSCKEDITKALKRYEHARVDRASKVHAKSLSYLDVYDLEDGPEQESRDRSLRGDDPDSAITYNKAEWTKWLYGTDVEAAVNLN